MSSPPYQTDGYNYYDSSSSSTLLSRSNPLMYSTMNNTAMTPRIPIMPSMIMPTTPYYYPQQNSLVVSPSYQLPSASSSSRNDDTKLEERVRELEDLLMREYRSKRREREREQSPPPPSTRYYSYDRRESFELPRNKRTTGQIPEDNSFYRIDLMGHHPVFNFPLLEEWLLRQIRTYMKNALSSAINNVYDKVSKGVINCYEGMNRDLFAIPIFHVHNWYGKFPENNKSIIKSARDDSKYYCGGGSRKIILAENNDWMKLIRRIKEKTGYPIFKIFYEYSERCQSTTLLFLLQVYLDEKQHKIAQEITEKRKRKLQRGTIL